MDVMKCELCETDKWGVEFQNVNYTKWARCANCHLTINYIGGESSEETTKYSIKYWNSIQELIRKGKMYDELKALVEATDRTTKTRSL